MESLIRSHAFGVNQKLWEKVGIYSEETSQEENRAYGQEQIQLIDQQREEKNWKQVGDRVDE